MGDTEPKPRSVSERRAGSDGSKGSKGGAGQRIWQEPFLRLLFFYAILIAVGAALVIYVPAVRNAWVGAPVAAGGSAFDQLSGKGEAIALTAQQRDPLDRAVTLFFITLGALAISVPVAWVYTFTRRLRYDPSLVHSVIILPLVVSAIVVIVKDSVPLAFSLAGIVAVVRFRNTLKDPKDAVYIFLTLGIGLAAGIQALDIALVMSLVFNAVVLVLWKFNLGAIYGESHRDILSIGDPDLLMARTASQRDAIRWRLSHDARDMKTDGILLVHTPQPEVAKEGLELTLATLADEWRPAGSFRRRGTIATFAVLLRLKDKKTDPLELLEEIQERWAEDIEAAEYIPYKKAAEKSDD